MSTTNLRLLRLERRLPRRPAPPAPSTFDPTRLTLREGYELDRLLAPLAPLPGEAWDLEPLTDAQLEWAWELTRKAEGLPPSPAFRYMPHRDSGIGECLCGGDGCAHQGADR